MSTHSATNNFIRAITKKVVNDRAFQSKRSIGKCSSTEVLKIVKQKAFYFHRCIRQSGIFFMMTISCTMQILIKTIFYQF